ncbi:GDSL-type esterase/lipase family protein [Hymenobacter setariae]|uniref:GDSL-type esterase/lipase family protein n=1 Tax=Hymenobacter setariae TaxID=2594794 RepID=UPI001F22AAC4|nr:GDSL-type esterase/lipase family protein [Hymenobacter setariae]
MALTNLGLSRAHAQTAPIRSLLIDFGVSDGTNGNITSSPDANGSYWNNLLNRTGVADTFRLVDKQNQATGVKVKVGPNFLTNGILNGGLLSPSTTLLGEYAVSTATQDYFFVQGTGSTSMATLRFSGLEASRRYVFHVFGSRQTADETRISQYKFTGANVSTITQTTTGPGVGANGYPGNNNTITKSDTLTADAAGGITLELSKIRGSFGYLNLMRIDVVPGRATTTPPVYYAFQNPGFELGNLAYWTTAGGSAGGGSVGQAPKHQGSFAARLTGMNNLRLEQRISYQATSSVSTYRLNGWFLNAAASALSGAQGAHLELLFYNSANALLGRFKSDSVQASTPTDTWVRLSAVGAIPAGTAFVQAAAVWHNSAGLATGSVYFDDLAVEPYIPINTAKTIYIGSSVPYGTGATGNRGYTTLYADLLAARSAAGIGGPWVTANVSVPGNNTVDVTNRFDNDIFPQNGKYVFIGLSLGNEGITGSNKDNTFNQFRDNMRALITHARANGLVPIVAGNYGRNDYTPTEYGYVQRINALLNGWSVPTVNLLGAVDDLSGNGRYTPGYWFDDLHPNDAGHAEMAHAIVPSLLDALAANKTQPRRRVSAGITLRNSATAPAPLVRLVPEDVVHPFTTTLRFRTASPGQLMQVLDSAGLQAGTIQVASTGKLLYTSAKGRTIAGTKVVNDNRWHKLVLTHYYGRGLTRLYVDSLAEGTAAERLRPTRLDLGGNAAPARVQLRDFFFYRSGMNEGEVLAMAADSLLKSSLELYAPLDGSRAVAADSLLNLAQSLNSLTRVAATPLAARESAEAAAISLYPNPSTGLVHLRASTNLNGTVVQLLNGLGQLVLTATVRQGSIDLGALPGGVFILQFQVAGETVRKRLVHQAK